jgi:hypothetical protein
MRTHIYLQRVVWNEPVLRRPADNWCSKFVCSKKKRDTCTFSEYELKKVIVCVFSYYCVCVLILLYVCPHTTVHVSSYSYMCPHPTTCVRILLYMCPHTNTICVLILRYIPTIRVVKRPTHLERSSPKTDAPREVLKRPTHLECSSPKTGLWKNP